MVLLRGDTESQNLLMYMCILEIMINVNLQLKNTLLERASIQDIYICNSVYEYIQSG